MIKMKKLLVFLPLFIITGCGEQSISSFDGWKPAEVKATLTPVIVDGKLLKSDKVYQVASADTSELATLPPIETVSEETVEPTVQSIVVKLKDPSGLQHLYAYDEEKKLVASFIISGAKGPVMPRSYDGEMPHNHLGAFTIFEKDQDHYSGIYHCPMPYALRYFSGHYIHATEPKYYSELGYPASHGCIRESLDDAKWLYSHTPIGCKVVIEG
jgi:lipoprotein-anchoring transpeptidase ErfK/SrfK